MIFKPNISLFSQIRVVVNNLREHNKAARLPEWYLIKALLSSKFPKGGIVIGGCGRSGTTLLLGMLSAHSKIHAINNETWALCPWVNPHKLYKNLKRDKIEDHELWWCEKTPMNIRNTLEILSFLGTKGKFLHIVRDGRDVITSRHPRIPDKYYVSIDRWTSDVRAGLAAEQSPQVMRLYYEDLVQTPKDTMVKVFKFIGAEFEQNVLSWEKSGTVRSDPALGGKAHAIHTRSVKRWQRIEHNTRIEKFMSKEDTRLLLNVLEYKD